MRILAMTALTAFLATGAGAHSPVESTAPASGSVVAGVPAEISLSFAGGMRLTRVGMVHQDHGPVQLDLGDQTGFDRVFVLPLQNMGPGSYRIEWRGLGTDGHVMQGEFSFQAE